MVVADAAVLSAATVIAAPLSLLIGPVLAWYLHGRRLDRLAVLCGLLGLAAAVSSVGLVVGVVWLVGARLGPLVGSGSTDGLVLLATGGAVLAVTLVALDIAAIRDLLPKRRAHVLLDVARLVATVILVGGSVAATIVQIAAPASEIGDVGPFALLSAVIGAITTLVGSALSAYLQKKRRVTSSPHVVGPSV